MDQVAQQESPIPMYYTNFLPESAFAQVAAPVVRCGCSVGAAKANLPCHKTTGSDVEL